MKLLNLLVMLLIKNVRILLEKFGILTQKKIRQLFLSNDPDSWWDISATKLPAVNSTNYLDSLCDANTTYYYSIRALTVGAIEIHPAVWSPQWVHFIRVI